MMNLAQEFWMLSHSQLVSLSGVALYIGSFAAVQLGRMSGDSIAFACVNVVAAILLLVGIYEAFNLATFLIQVCFATVGGIGISRRLKSRMSKSRKLRI